MQPNKIHVRDKQNATKHRKMINRGSEHPREGMPDKTVSFRMPPFDKVVFHDGTTHDQGLPVLKEVQVVRNNGWDGDTRYF